MIWPAPYLTTVLLDWIKKPHNWPSWLISGSRHCPVESTPSVYLPNTCEVTSVPTTSSWTAVTPYLVSSNILKLGWQDPHGSTGLSVPEINVQLRGHTPGGKDDAGWKPSLITSYRPTRKSSSNDVPVIFSGFYTLEIQHSRSGPGQDSRPSTGDEPPKHHSGNILFCIRSRGHLKQQKTAPAQRKNVRNKASMEWSFSSPAFWLPAKTAVLFSL